MKMNKKILIRKNITIKKALYLMKLVGLKNLFVVNNDNKLLASISGGDLRNALLKGKKLNDHVFALANYNPKFVNYSDKKNLSNKLEKLFKYHKLELVPILDQKKIVKDVIAWADFFKKKRKISKKKTVFYNKNLDVVIMAGGKGTRLKPFTEILPKPLMPIKNKTIIENILNFFIKNEFKKFFITINFKSEILKAYFKEISENYAIKFIQEKKPLGTIGSIKLIKTKNKNTIVANCDVIYKINLKRFVANHIKKKFDISFIASNKKLEVPYGVCRFKNNKFEKFEEKPKLFFYINTGLYIINNRLKKLIPKNKKFDATDLINLANLNKYKIGIYKINENQWFDTGQWSELSKTVKNLNV